MSWHICCNWNIVNTYLLATYIYLVLSQYRFLFYRHITNIGNLLVSTSYQYFCWFHNLPKCAFKAALCTQSPRRDRQRIQLRQPSCREQLQTIILHSRKLGSHIIASTVWLLVVFSSIKYIRLANKDHVHIFFV